MKWGEQKQHESRKDHGEGEIRVTDRRRNYLDEDAAATTDSSAGRPDLKPSYVAELEARTQAAEKLAQDIQARFEELKTRLQRETDETRQRLNRAADERAERAIADFIAGLLPVLDNLERATEAAGSGSSIEQLSVGVKQTAENFKTALAAAGVESVAAAGELFDPAWHEAVETVPSDDPELDGRVVKEYTRGYRLGERLLRPARVKVGRAPQKVTSA